MLEISVAKLKSPASVASAASARNCKLVKPVSNANVIMIAISTADRAIIKSSSTDLAATGPHSSVWYVLCAQSNCRSFGHNSCGNQSWS